MAQTKAQLLGPVVGDVVMDVSTLSLDAEGNKVGIGTTGATATLHVFEPTEGDAVVQFNSGDNFPTVNRGLVLKAATGPTGYTGSKWIFNAQSSGGRLEFQTASSPRLTILEGGNIGIGEISPDVRLHVKKQFDTAYSLTNVADEANHLLKLENPSTTANAFSGMQFRVGSGADLFFGAIQQSVNHGDFFFANQNSPQKEMMRIKSTGNVGIGTDNPGAILHTHAQSGGLSNIRLSGTAADQVEYDIRQGIVGVNNAGFSIRDLTNSATRFAITSGGDVGIGTSTPSSNGGTTLEIYNDTTPTLKLNDGGEYKALFQLRGNDLEIRGSNGVMEFYTGSTDGASSSERLRIDSAGNTTLGYAGTSLHFYNGFNNSTARIQNGGGSNSSELKFLVKNAGVESEKMRLTSTAGLAIVTAGSMPANAGNETLYVHGEGHNGHGTSNTRSVVSIIGALTSNSNAAGIWMGARTNENTAVIGTRTASGNLAFETYSGGWGERMRLLNTGQLVVGGTANLAHPNMDDLIIGDANGNRGLTICSGTGAFGSVCFGDSADGSGNDRYEGYVEYYHNDNSLRLGTAHTEKINISSTGKLLLKATGGSGVIADFQEGTSATDSESLIAVTTGYSAGSNEGSVRFGSKRTGNGNAGHFIVSTREGGSNINSGWYTRFMIKDNSQIQFNTYRGVKCSNEGGSTSLYRFRLAIEMLGNVAYTIRLRNFGNGAHHVRLMASHWSGGYQLVKESYYFTSTTTGLSEDSRVNVSSSYQGAWSVSRPSSGQTGYTTDLIITKSAGSYGGGMTSMIDITTNRDLFLVSIT